MQYLGLKRDAKCYSTVSKCYAQSLGTKNNIAFFPMKTHEKYFCDWHDRCIYIGIRKRELRMLNPDLDYVSDCCGVEMTGIQMDYGICPDCGEHCELVADDADYIPGVDDGEAI
jgi:hypothetical protein